MPFFKTTLTQVKAFAFDVDGVISATTQPLSSTGETIRTSNLKDGFAMVYALRMGYPIAVITGGKTVEVLKRCEKLGIKDLYAGSLSKVPALNDFLRKYNLKPEEVAYMGDDLPDYPVMKMVGVPVCPRDAAPEIKAISLYVSDRNGGEGCVRDLIEQVLRVQGKWINLETMDWDNY